VAIYISRHHTKDSYLDLARAFGGKHHTLISAVQKIAGAAENSSLRHVTTSPGRRCLSVARASSTRSTSTTVGDARLGPPILALPDTAQPPRPQDGAAVPVRGGNRPVGNDQLNDVWREVQLMASVERPVTVHGIRHSFHDLARQQGVPDTVVKAMAGTSTCTTAGEECGRRRRP